MRVLDEKTMDISFNESGKIFGVEFSGAATVTSIVRPDGSIYGEGQAILNTKDGEMVTWKGIIMGINGDYKASISYFDKALAIEEYKV